MRVHVIDGVHARKRMIRDAAAAKKLYARRAHAYPRSHQRLLTGATPPPARARLITHDVWVKAPQLDSTGKQ